MNKRKNYLTDLYRYSYLKLIVPIQRERHNPEYVARGVAVGLFCGFTPMVWQMSIVFVIWIIAKFFKVYFSLPVGLAMTWISNTFTNIPLLYLYYITGSFLMRQDIGGYDDFMGFFQSGILEGIKQTFIFWGKPILIGSFMYMLTFSILGYFLSYKYATKLKEKYLKKHKNIE